MSELFSFIALFTLFIVMIFNGLFCFISYHLFNTIPILFFSGDKPSGTNNHSGPFGTNTPSGADKSIGVDTPSGTNTPSAGDKPSTTNKLSNKLFIPSIPSYLLRHKHTPRSLPTPFSKTFDFNTFKPPFSHDNCRLLFDDKSICIYFTDEFPFTLESLIACFQRFHSYIYQPITTVYYYPKNFSDRKLFWDSLVCQFFIQLGSFRFNIPYFCKLVYFNDFTSFAHEIYNSYTLGDFYSVFPIRYVHINAYIYLLCNEFSFLDLENAAVYPSIVTEKKDRFYTGFDFLPYNFDYTSWPHTPYAITHFSRNPVNYYQFSRDIDSSTRAEYYITTNLFFKKIGMKRNFYNSIIVKVYTGTNHSNNYDHVFCFWDTLDPILHRLVRPKDYDRSSILYTRSMNSMPCDPYYRYNFFKSSDSHYFISNRFYDNGILHCYKTGRELRGFNAFPDDLTIRFPLMTFTQ